MADEDIITVRNPSLGEDSPPAQVRRDAYEQTWRAKGFEIVDPVHAKVGTLLNRNVDDLNTLTKDELSQAAALAGLSVDEKTSKPKLISALTDALGGSDQEEAAATQGEEVANG